MVLLSLCEVKQEALVLVRAIVVHLLRVSLMNDVGIIRNEQMVVSELWVTIRWVVVVEKVVFERLLVFFFFIAV